MDKWVIDEESKTEVFNTIKSDSTLVKKWASFESDVINNPYFHPKYKRIEKLKGKTSFPPGSYRYKKEPLRVVYIPEGTTKIIYPLEAATSTSISYKKRTKGK
jgi:hypothetical protein